MNEFLSPYQRKVFVHIFSVHSSWEKWTRILLKKTMSFFNSINAILYVKKSYRASTIKISYNSDLW